MASHAVRPAVAAEVREYYASVWLPRQVDFTESSLMSELPPRLSRKVMRDITIGVILGSQVGAILFLLRVPPSIHPLSLVLRARAPPAD